MLAMFGPPCDIVKRMLAKISMTDAKRRVLDRLKRAESLTVPELAATLGLTEAAVRQHLDALARAGLVESTERAVTGRGRPPLEWRLTPIAVELFPDRHDDLTVELIAAIRAAVGDEGLGRVIDERMRAQLAGYSAIIPRDGSLRSRANALAQQRSAEGYMAEVTSSGDAVVLIEHHCPVCSAATECQGLCRGELELFRAALGDDIDVERTTHLLSGDARCTYRLTEKRPGFTEKRPGRQR
jgi:predicted ArsR family transcriptional regulator